MPLPSESFGEIYETMHRLTGKGVVITELNPQSDQQPPPGLCTRSVRIVSSGINTAVFITHPAERKIPISSGEVKIIGEVRARGKAPRSRLVVPDSIGSVPLRIISACPAPHEIVLGRGEIVRFEPEVGANCELIGIAGAVTAIGLFKAEIVYEDAADIG